MKRSLIALLLAAFAATAFATEQSANDAGSDWGALEQQKQYPQPGY